MEFGVLGNFPFLGWVFSGILLIYPFDFVFCLLGVGIYRFSSVCWWFVERGASGCGIVVFEVGIDNILMKFAISGGFFLFGVFS